MARTWKLFTVALVLALWASCVSASDETGQTTTNTALPKLAIDSLVHDFGAVWVNDTLDHAFMIRNEGQAPLEIVKVKPACGCTATGKHPEVIAPGDSGEFPFKLNTRKMHGKFSKTISIVTNDPDQPKIVLRLMGDVRHYIEVEPRVANFSRVQEDSVATKTLNITNNTERPLELTIDKKLMPKCFDGELTELVPGKAFDLTITAHPPYVTGINRFPLKITTNLKEQPELAITCMATLPERLQVKPDKLALSSATKNASTRKLWVTNNGGTPVVVTEAVSDDERLGIEVKEVEAGKRYQIVVTIPADYSPKSDKTAIVIKTDDSKTPEVVVPINQRQVNVGRRAERPAMKMEGTTPEPVSAKTHDGQDVLLGGSAEEATVAVFYASWCGFSRKAMPGMQALHEEFIKEGINARVVLINCDDRGGRRPRTVEQSIEHYELANLDMPLILDNDGSLRKAWMVTSYPTTFVVGPSGVVEAVHVGAGGDFQRKLAEDVQASLKSAGKSGESVDVTATGDKD